MSSDHLKQRSYLRLNVEYLRLYHHLDYYRNPQLGCLDNLPITENSTEFHHLHSLLLAPIARTIIFQYRSIVSSESRSWSPAEQCEHLRQQVSLDFLFTCSSELVFGWDVGAFGNLAPLEVNRGLRSCIIIIRPARAPFWRRQMSFVSVELR